MKMQWLAIMMAAVFFGVTVSLLGSLFRPVNRSHPVAGNLPAVWRLAWPWLQKMAPVAVSLLSWRSRKGLAVLILCAGLPAELSAGHVVAAQGICGVLGGMSVWLAAWWMRLDHHMGSVICVVIIGALGSATLPRLWLYRVRRHRIHCISRELPFLLDMTTLCVESGLNLQGALQQAAQYGPSGPMRNELQHVVADMRAGVPRLEALRAWSRRVDAPGVRALIVALAQADTLGMSLGPILRLQAERRRAERFHQIEKLALQAPVKMLFPLICCIFPCTFIVLAFPIAAQLIGVE
jgi:tight adherence protein C